MKYQTKRKGFSLLELIFVIVILGIVASIGSELIVRVYQQYIVQRAQHRASIKTELAATQIANRLASAIPGTVFRRTLPSGGTIENVNDAMSLSGDSYKVLQWVGADTEGFNASSTPGWSGFCDINVSTKHSIITPGSNLALEDALVTNFGFNNKFAIYFPYDTTPYYGSRSGASTILLDNNASHIVEHYKLARTSYALVCENGGTNYCGDLTLHYNFIPTPAPSNNIPSTAKKSVLLKNVTTFKFKGAGRTIRFKICKEEQISENVNENIVACKEKAVF